MFKCFDRSNLFLKILDEFSSFDDELHKSASFNFPSLLLGNLTNAWPAILLGSKQEFKAVDISSLISSLFFSSFVAFGIG